MAGFGEGDGAVMRNYKNILVINLMHIGDMMLATPVLRTLRANYPQAKISILVRSGSRLRFPLSRPL